MLNENPVMYALHWWANQNAGVAFAQFVAAIMLGSALLKMHAKASVNAHIRAKRKANQYSNKLKNLNK